MMRFLGAWLKKDDASAAIEAGFLFPVMVTIMLGVVDVGIAITINQKVVNASHEMVDLLTRGKTVTNALLNDAVVAAQLSIQPYDTASMGYDVEGVYLLGVTATPTLAPCGAPCGAWNDTANMGRNTAVAATLAAAGYVGAQDEGLIAVTVKYTYTPLFTQFLTGSFDIQEVSFARGRFGGFITRTS
jgi:Flp pilus assembly protein TadG